MTSSGAARQTIAALAVVAVLVAAAAAVGRLREARYPTPAVSEASLYVTSGTTIRRLTAGYTALAADLYWIRAIQYYGDIRLRLGSQLPALPEANPAATTTAYPLLYPLLDLTTTLDPLFNIAYRFGAIFLAEAQPGGAGRPDLAIALLEKGLRHRPDKWEYMQDIGFVHYWWRHDYPAAAAWFGKAGQMPGAPWFLRSLAATTLAEGGDRRSSRTMWQSIRESAEIDWLRGEADRRLLQLDAMDFMSDLQARLDRAAPSSAAGAARDWTNLVRAGVIPGIPVDPTGTPYELDAEGRVSLSSTSALYPLPPEPGRSGSGS
jgi:hypothetical protein